MPISWPNPMFDYLLESSRRDDSNKWSNIGFGQVITQVEPVEDNFTDLIWSPVMCLYSLYHISTLVIFHAGFRFITLVKRCSYANSVDPDQRACVGAPLTRVSTVCKATVIPLTLSPPNKLSSAKFLICLNFQSALMLLRVGEKFVWVSNSWNPDEMPSYSASHQDPSYLHYGSLVVLGRLRVKVIITTLFIFKFYLISKIYIEGRK